MKTIVTWLCLVIFSACTNAASTIDGSDTIRRSKKIKDGYHEFTNNCLFLNPDQTNSVGINDEFIVQLPVTPSSGYLWYYTISSSESIALIHERVFDDNSPEVIGGTQNHVWKFKAKVQDKVNITYKKYRKWLGEESAIDEYNYTVSITKK